MIDINLLRVDKGGDPDIVKQSERKRGRDLNIIDEIIQLDKKWIEQQFKLETVKKDLNSISKEISNAKKKNTDTTNYAKTAAKLKSLIPEISNASSTLLNQRDTLLKKIGNILLPDVPISNDEANNAIIKTWGEELINDLNKKNYLKPHYELIQKIDGIETKKAAAISGHRGYYLKGYAALLNQALLQYGVAFLTSHNYTPIQTPLFIRESYMSKAAELTDFNETLYKIPMGNDEEPLYLIATSEQPLCCLHSNEMLQSSKLPIKYCGISNCFRKEAGAHGKEMKGIFRVHQFEKIEQFILTNQDKSNALQDEMINISEKFYQSLNIPYRVVSIVSGALNDAAARKYDLEAWFPSYNKYRELVSCSNCTDYQSRALNIKVDTISPSSIQSKFVHLLNGTLCASERTLCCILENWQDSNKIIVPEVLRPYMNGLSFIPFSNI